MTADEVLDEQIIPRLSLSLASPRGFTFDEAAAIRGGTIDELKRFQDNAMQVAIEACCAARCNRCKEGDDPTKPTEFSIWWHKHDSICPASTSHNVTPDAIRAEQEKAEIERLKAEAE